MYIVYVGFKNIKLWFNLVKGVNVCLFKFGNGSGFEKIMI